MAFLKEWQEQYVAVIKDQCIQASKKVEISNEQPHKNSSPMIEKNAGNYKKYGFTSINWCQSLTYVYEHKKLILS